MFVKLFISGRGRNESFPLLLLNGISSLAIENRSWKQPNVFTFSVLCIKEKISLTHNFFLAWFLRLI